MPPDWRSPVACAQLVENPNDAGVFLPRLLPGLEKVSQEVPDPECRSVAGRARDTLLKIVPDPSAVAPPEAHDFKVRRVWRGYPPWNTQQPLACLCCLCWDPWRPASWRCLCCSRPDQLSACWGGHVLLGQEAAGIGLLKCLLQC